MALDRVERIHSRWPLFRLSYDGAAALYTPGHAVDERGADLAALTELAAAAEESWQRYVDRPYSPTCLTLYLSNQCNLGCAYCYSAPLDATRPRTHQQPVLNIAAARAAARVVASNCEDRGAQCSLIFHGGGEPTQHWDLLTQLYHDVAGIARDRGVDLWSYIATNGVLPAAKVDWLIERFSVIGLSCDGPPSLQDAQRPSASGQRTSRAVENTARRLAERGAEFHVRVTITRASVARQAEIVEYCIEHLHARTIRFEPAYQARADRASFFAAADAPEFVSGFLEARASAHRLGAQLHLSGIRLNEIHSAHCNPLRDVLQISPDGRASACFLTADGDRPDDELLTLGSYDEPADTFVIDAARAAALRRRAAQIPARCYDCVNVYHCARDCPDVCLVSSPAAEATPGFRCRVQQLLAHELIKEWVTHGRAESL